jgi:ABC-type Fe3+ transport system substrate-binding protein
VVPKETPLIVEGIAIIEGAPHREWAEKFYEFVTSKEMLVQQANNYAKFPARNDISAEQLPEWLAQLKYEPMVIDWKKFATDEQNWMQTWEQQVLNDAEINARRLTR